jgi:hypothetical protein
MQAYFYCLSLVRTLWEAIVSASENYLNFG